MAVRVDQPPAPWRRRLYLPAYRVSEAAHLAGVSPQTVARWYYGYVTAAGLPGKPVFPKGKPRGAPLSYLQLVEVSFVACFRNMGLTLARIRAAHAYLSKVFRAEYPFAQLRLKTDGVHILKQHEEEYGLQHVVVVADAEGKMMWEDLILRRIYEFDYAYGLALRWHPRGKDVPIVVDPRVSFGAPMIEGTGLPTWVVKERLAAGESLDEIREDLGLTKDEVQYALAFEGVGQVLAA